jgi:hypothetical protein
MFRNRIIITNVFKTQQRNMGMLKKNVRVEENAGNYYLVLLYLIIIYYFYYIYLFIIIIIVKGLREISYKTWQFDQGSLGRIIKWGVLPSVLFCVFVVEECVSYKYNYLYFIILFYIFSKLYFIYLSVVKFLYLYFIYHIYLYYSYA